MSDTNSITFDLFGQTYGVWGPAAAVIGLIWLTLGIMKAIEIVAWIIGAALRSRPQ